jgi:geranylgeranyl transferase type-1 subunit beta
MLDRPLHSSEPAATSAVDAGIPDRKRLLRFLAGRQFTYLEHEEEGQDHDEDGDIENFIEAKMGSLNLEEGSRHVGLNGRWNKKADTCYTWWVAGTLAVRLARMDTHTAQHG